jgi:U2 small nuclear ribonucleoprotein B''
MPSAAAGAVTATELQQSIFNAPPSAAATTTQTAPPPGLLKPATARVDHIMEDAKSPSTSIAGQKRAREEEDDADSDGDVAMEEDSDDE